MRIRWLGHSCFTLTSAKGVKVLTDPYDVKVGYVLQEDTADIVTTSHNHHDHNYIEAVKDGFVHIHEPGEYAVKGINIKGIKTYHDESGGSVRGTNTIFIFEIDGMKVCHCGDLGHVLTDRQVMDIGRIDVLLLPVGGTFTIDAENAARVRNQLNPRITIPMHFKTEALSFSLDGVNKFLAAAGGGEMTGCNEIELNAENIDNYSSVLVLSYK